MRTISLDATPEDADWLKPHTPYALGDPPMIGWWETIIADMTEDRQPPSGAVSYMRWWGGPVSGWSIAVTPYYQGLELHRVAEMPWRPSTATSVIWWRGFKEPQAGCRYPLGIRCIDVSTVRKANSDLVNFRDAAGFLAEAIRAAAPVVPRSRVRVEPEVQMPLFKPRTRVNVNGVWRTDVLSHEGQATYGLPTTKPRVLVIV